MGDSEQRWSLYQDAACAVAGGGPDGYLPQLLFEMAAGGWV